jgi:hypothetical protein
MEGKSGRARSVLPRRVKTPHLVGQTATAFDIFLQPSRFNLSHKTSTFKRSTSKQSLGWTRICRECGGRAWKGRLGRCQKPSDLPMNFQGGLVWHESIRVGLTSLTVCFPSGSAFPNRLFRPTRPGRLGRRVGYQLFAVFFKLSSPPTGSVSNQGADFIRFT